MSWLFLNLYYDIYILNKTLKKQHMKISEIIKKLQSHQEKYGDVDVKQLMGIYTINGQYLAEKIMPINKIKYNKKRNILLIDFV